MILAPGRSLRFPRRSLVVLRHAGVVLSLFALHSNVIGPIIPFDESDCRSRPIRLQMYFPAMLRTQIDFLNHGILPFAGRADAVATIVGFWRETAGASGLRGMLVVGEAGIGKSRLVEESSAAISGGGGVVVSTRLYPDSPTALVPLIARALGRSPLLSSLLKEEPHDDLGSIGDAIVRICGLRPTLLVVEDLHLLAADGLRDLSLLLSRLVDEPLSLLFTARPVELPARGVIEPYLVDDIELQGLQEEAIAIIWRELIGEEPDAELVTTLRSRTTGNALALRSALRAGLRDRRRTTPSVDRDLFLEGLDRNVRLLSDGMVAHLADQERAWSARLAGLGEVFARDAALHLFGGDGHPLDELAFKGIVSVASSLPSPLDAMRSSALPMSFTHSLLHRHFVDRSVIDVVALVDAIAADVPLYSILPFEAIARHAGEIASPAETLRDAAMRAIRVASSLHLTPDWPQADVARRAAVVLEHQARTGLPRAESDPLRARLLISLLTASLRGLPSEHDTLLGELLELTVNPRDHDSAILRLAALIPYRRSIRRRDMRESLAPMDQVNELVAAFPSIVWTNEYISHLHESIRVAIVLRDITLVAEYERLLATLLEDPALPYDVGLYARRTIIPPLLSIYSTPEELTRRRRQLADLEGEALDAIGQLNLSIWKAYFLEGVLDIEGTLAEVERAVPLYRDRGIVLEATDCRRMGIFLRALSHGDLKHMTAEIEELSSSASEIDPALRARKELLHLVEAGLLLDDPAWLVAELERRGGSTRGFSTAMRALVALACAGGSGRDDALRDLAESIEGNVGDGSLLDPLICFCAGLPGADPDAAIGTLPMLLDGPTLNINGALTRRATLDLLRELPDSPKARSILREAGDMMPRGARELIEWFLARRLFRVADRLVERYGSLLDDATLKDIRRRIGAQEKEGGGESGAEERRVRVSMLGSIVIQPRSGDPVRLRGAQVCTLLGLLIATEMLDRPLSSQEATAIVMGNDRDPEAARKAMNFAVFRLREAMGSDAVITGGETPRLNLECVEVDLLIAWRHLRMATTGLSEGALMRSIPELTAALEIAGGLVPFPTLYDDFFEALRGDIEAELRDTTLRLARLLLREGDAVTSGRLLHGAYRAMPEDEEIVELLRESLRAQGKRAEAIRVGLVPAEEE